MLKLMKYELRKTAFSKLVLLVITAVAEIAFLIGVFWKKDNILAMGIIFLVMCTIFGVIYIGIESGRKQMHTADYALTGIKMKCQTIFIIRKKYHGKILKEKIS